MRNSEGNGDKEKYQQIFLKIEILLILKLSRVKLPG